MFLKTALAAVVCLVPAGLSQSQVCVGGVCGLRSRIVHRAPAVTYSAPMYTVPMKSAYTSYTDASGVTYQPQTYATGGYYTTVRQRAGLFGRRVRTVQRWVPRRTEMRYVPVSTQPAYSAPTETTTSPSTTDSSASDAACCPGHERRLAELEDKVTELEAKVAELIADRWRQQISKRMPPVKWRRLPPVRWGNEGSTALAMK